MTVTIEKKANPRLHPRELDRMGIAERKLVEAALRDPEASPSLRGDEPEITLALRLAAINAAIWERENRVRRTVTTDLAGIGRLTLEIMRLNDWRAEIVGEEKFR